MAKTLLLFLGILLCMFLGSQILGSTDHYDVVALQNFYISLEKPPQLSLWKSENGDPCQEMWFGVECRRSSVIHLKLQSLNLKGNVGSVRLLSPMKKLAHLNLSNNTLHGFLGGVLKGFANLKQLDLSFNEIRGQVPFNWPITLTSLNLGGNLFTYGIPRSLYSMKQLQYINLSSNAIDGPLGDFSSLCILREMDLSLNRFSGDLPKSLATLSNMRKLFLQSNQFTGSVEILANLLLTDLNLEDNYFFGIIPYEFRKIKNLWLGSNAFYINYTNHDLLHEKNTQTSPTLIIWACWVLFLITTAVVAFWIWIEFSYNKELCQAIPNDLRLSPESYETFRLLEDEIYCLKYTEMDIEKQKEKVFKKLNPYMKPLWIVVGVVPHILTKGIVKLYVFVPLLGVLVMLIVGVIVLFLSPIRDEEASLVRRYNRRTMRLITFFRGVQNSADVDFIAVSFMSIDAWVRKGAVRFFYMRYAKYIGTTLLSIAGAGFVIFLGIEAGVHHLT